MSAFQKFRDGPTRRHATNGLFFAAIGAFLLWLAIFGAVAYIAVHFIRKFW